MTEFCQAKVMKQQLTTLTPGMKIKQKKDGLYVIPQSMIVNPSSSTGFKILLNRKYEKKLFKQI